MLSDTDHELLELPAFAKLATVMPDGSPQVTVMWFRAEDGVLRMIAPAHLQKVRNLQRDPRATVVIDHPENGYHYVELRCAVKIVQDDAAAREELRRIAARYVGDHADTYVDKLSADPRVIIVLRPERINSRVGQPPMPQG